MGTQSEHVKKIGARTDAIAANKALTETMSAATRTWADAARKAAEKVQKLGEQVVKTHATIASGSKAYRAYVGEIAKVQAELEVAAGQKTPDKAKIKELEAKIKSMDKTADKMIDEINKVVDTLTEQFKAAREAAVMPALGA